MIDAKPSVRSGFSFFVLATSAIVFGFFSYVTVGQEYSPQKAQWQEDVHQFGFPKINRSMKWGTKISISNSEGTFTFLDNSTLLVDWITPDEPLPHLPKRAKFSQVPAKLHILLLDAKTGAKAKEEDLSVPSAPTALLLNRSGNLIVRAGDSVTCIPLTFFN